jgi:hypothetical protein
VGKPELLTRPICLIRTIYLLDVVVRRKLRHKAVIEKFGFQSVPGAILQNPNPADPNGEGSWLNVHLSTK